VIDISPQYTNSNIQGGKMISCLLEKQKRKGTYFQGKIRGKKKYLG
jgi:hypothetical protein